MFKQICQLYTFFKEITFNKDKKRIVFLFLTALLSNILIIFIPLIQKNIINTIVEGKLYPNSLFLFFVLSLTLSLITLLEIFLIINVQISIQKNLSFMMLNSITRKNNLVIDTRGSGAFMSSLFGDSEQMSMLFGSNYFFGVGNLISTVVILIIASHWSWIFPVIVISSYILMIIVINISKKYYGKYFSMARELVFKLNPRVLEFIENRKTVMGYSNINDYLNDLEKVFNERDSYFKKSTLSSELGGLLIDSIKNIALVIFFILAMIEILNSRLELASFIAMTSYFASVFMPIYSIKQINDSLARFEMLYKRNKDNLELPLRKHLPENADIYIDNISLEYDNNIILNNINLEIDKLYGVVGISGEGKTTLLKLLTGEVKPKFGNITYGKRNIEDYPMSVIYSGYRTYYQDPEIFDKDLIFNITLGKKGVNSSEYDEIFNDNANLIYESYRWLKININNSKFELNEYLNILKELFNLTSKEILNKKIIGEIYDGLSSENIDKISEFMASIYTAKNYYVLDKYNNIVKDLGISYLGNRNFGQRGGKLSGGEKNKVSLARFLLPELELPVIIDEPFTNLDLISEEENLKVLEKYMKNSRGILVSHKLNVINALSDEIIVIENGTISSKGSHQELMNNSKLYRSLYEKYIKNNKF